MEFHKLEARLGMSLITKCAGCERVFSDSVRGYRKLCDECHRIKESRRKLRQYHNRQYRRIYPVNCTPSIPIRRICPHCGIEFTARSNAQMYCQRNHQTIHNRKKKVLRASVMALESAVSRLTLRLELKRRQLEALQ